MKYVFYIVIINLIFGISNINAQEKSAEELAKMAQNPLANMMSFPFQNNTTFGNGDFSRPSNVLNVQPVLPFYDGHLITRTIIPIATVPLGEFGNTTALSDINFTAFYSPTSKNGLVMGVGPALIFPTYTELSSKQWSAGPSIVLLKISKKTVYGFVWNNVWSYAGDYDAAAVNKMLFQYFFNYNLADGWYLSTAPIITANWEANDENKWTVPFGGGVGKIIKVGSLPLNLQTQVFYNAIKPNAMGDVSLRLQLQILLPK